MTTMAVVVDAHMVIVMLISQLPPLMLWLWLRLSSLSSFIFPAGEPRSPPFLLQPRQSHWFGRQTQLLGFVLDDLLGPGGLVCSSQDSIYVQLDMSCKHIVMCDCTELASTYLFYQAFSTLSNIRSRRCSTTGRIGNPKMQRLIFSCRCTCSVSFRVHHPQLLAELLLLQDIRSASKLKALEYCRVKAR